MWLPLQFPNNATLSMSYARELTIDTATGQVTPVGSGYHRIVVRHSGKCLDLSSASQDRFVQFKQYSCNDGQNQQVQLQPL